MRFLDRRAVAGALFVLVSATAACAVAEPPAPTHGRLALPTLDASNDGVEVCPQALLGPVTLEERPQSVEAPVVAVVPNGDVVELVWARGFVADFTPLVIRDATGQQVAEGGDEVWLTGGGEPFYVCEVSASMP